MPKSSNGYVVHRLWPSNRLLSFSVLCLVRWGWLVVGFVGEKFIIKIFTHNLSAWVKTEVTWKMYPLSANSHVVCPVFGVCVFMCVCYLCMCMASAWAKPTAGMGRQPGSGLSAQRFLTNTAVKTGTQPLLVLYQCAHVCLCEFCSTHGSRRGS